MNFEPGRGLGERRAVRGIETHDVDSRHQDMQTPASMAEIGPLLQLRFAKPVDINRDN
jgi:hypothetical protein